MKKARPFSSLVILMRVKGQWSYSLLCAIRTLDVVVHKPHPLKKELIQYYMSCVTLSETL